WLGQSEFGRPTHVRKLAVRRKNGSLRNPVDFETRSIKAGGDVSTNRCLSFEQGLPRENENSIIAPIGDNLFDILPSGGEVGPLRISAQQLLPFARGIELLPRTAHKRECDDNEQQAM